MNKLKNVINEYADNKISKDFLKNNLENLTTDKDYCILANAYLALLFNKNDFKPQKPSPKNKLLVLINGNVVNPFKKEKKQNLLIYKNKIIATSNDYTFDMDFTPESLEIIDAKNLLITPGLIDQHIHGGYGCNFNTASEKEIQLLCKKLPEQGVTSILATIMTDSKENIQKQIKTIKNAKKNISSNSTKIEGIHLEGPFLSKTFKGIHPESNIIKPTINNFKDFNDAEIKIVSYAPEDDENLKFTKHLKKLNIIASAGHSQASADIAKAASKYGLKQLTHLFNAMTPLHHRNPGIIGEGLTNDNLYVEIIPDGLHLNPLIVDIVLRTKSKSKVILISDSLPLNNADKDYVIFGGQKVYNKDNKAVNKDGTMAGSLIFINKGIQNIVKWGLADFQTAMGFATQNIAKNLNLKNNGTIKKGNLADIVLWDKKLNIKATFINGEMAFNSSL